MNELPLRQIIQGDCLEIMRLFPNKSFDVLFTDPPYGMNKDYGNGSDRKVNSCYLIKESLRACFRVLKWDSPVIVWSKPSSLDIFISALKDAGFTFITVLTLYKSNDCTYPRYAWLMNTESIIVASKGDFKIPKPKKYAQDCYVFVNSSTIRGKLINHPSIKPLSVVTDLIDKIVSNDAIVLDPFLGSGTTAVACEKLRRKWIGIEINPEYCEIARKRLEPWMNQTRLYGLENQID